MKFQDSSLHGSIKVKCDKNVIFTLLVIKLVLISVPTIYLTYCYNLIATHKILESRPWGPQKL